EVTRQLFCSASAVDPRDVHSFPTRRSSDLDGVRGPELLGQLQLPGVEVDGDDLGGTGEASPCDGGVAHAAAAEHGDGVTTADLRSEEHTSELQSRENLVCRLLLEKKK